MMTLLRHPLLIVALVVQFFAIGVFTLRAGESEEAAAANSKVNKMNTGWIDAITAEGILIDDMLSPVSTVKVYDKNGFLKDISSLRVGQYVAFERDEQHTEIHFVDREEERPSSVNRTGSGDSQGSAPAETGIRQVDGVWKN